MSHCVLTEEDLGSGGRVSDTDEQPFVCGDFGEGPWDVEITRRQRCSNIDDEFELGFMVGGELFSAVWFGELTDRPPE